MKKLVSLAMIALLLAVWGCTGYEYKPLPFKSVESYPNRVTVAGAVIAAKAWTDEAEAWQAFGFNIRGAGLTPVQVVVDNKGDQALQVITEQTLLMDDQDNLWNLLPAKAAYDRIEKDVRVERMGGEGGRQAALAGAAGAILGGAFAIITGQNIAEAAGKGAVAGAAIGAVKGGAEGYGDRSSQSQIREDLRNRSIQDKAFKPKDITHGFFFFPGEVKHPTVLRLKLREEQTKQEHLVELRLESPAEKQ
ncbi:MAG: hypothetical protein KKB20_16035 [Proteobacteria bacterium]|nr:hypothetical protein [Pseudomonadota bacterium]